MSFSCSDLYSDAESDMRIALQMMGWGVFGEPGGGKDSGGEVITGIIVPLATTLLSAG